jgi:hypothetical protein
MPATTARMVSTGLAAAAGAATGAGRGAGAAGLDAAGAAAPARGALAAAGAGVPIEGAAGAGIPPPVGPPGGNVGSLIVGAADGLGGKLMRTVSFLGWTFPVSFLGGTAPAGMFGMFSAITSVCYPEPRVAPTRCQTIIPAKCSPASPSINMRSAPTKANPEPDRNRPGSPE